MDNPWIFVSIAACLVACGWIVAYMFERKNRSPALGFALGLFLAWVGILIAMFLGPGRSFSGAKSRLWLCTQYRKRVHCCGFAHDRSSAGCLLVS